MHTPTHPFRLLAALWAVFALTGCGTMQYDPTSDREVLNAYTIGGDIELGLQTRDQIIAQSREAGTPINQDRARLRALSNIVTRIAAVSHQPDLPYSVTLIHSNIVNAACTPGGQIIVWEGLYDPQNGLAHTEDELAAVMAHEIAHATARHSTERLTWQQPISLALVLGTLAADALEEEDWAWVLGGTYLAYQGLVLPAYSREDELEADRLGLFYMADAGYDPRAATAVWQRMHEREGDPGLLVMLATHPSHQRRFEALNLLMPEALARYRRARGE